MRSFSEGKRRREEGRERGEGERGGREREREGRKKGGRLVGKCDIDWCCVH